MFEAFPMVTVVRRQINPVWEDAEIRNLLPLGAPIQPHPKSPKVIAIPGIHSKQTIAKLLGHHGFRCRFISRDRMRRDFGLRAEIHA